MKKSFLKKPLSIILSGLALCLTLTGCNDNNTSKPNNTPDEYGVVADDYGIDVLIKVHNGLLEKHTTYVPYFRFSQYQSDSKKYISVDTYAEDHTKNVQFYTGKLLSKPGSYTREHVWACANSNGMWTHNKSDGANCVDGSGYKGGGSDLYHIRPCDSAINTWRGNGKFYEFNDNEKKYEYTDGGPYKMYTNVDGDFATKVEPDDHYKGDIARILMYVYVHYINMGVTNDYTGPLKLTDVFNSNYSLSEVQQLMVKWNELDPVDETEKLRNDTVETIQGNRNPFVDHPEYMRRIFNLDEE